MANTYDLQIAALNAGETGARLSLPAGGPALVTGVVKLGQRWLLEFLTEAGSLPLLPRRGCSFLLALRRGQLATEADIFNRFQVAAGEVEANLAADEREDDPPDERYQSARLVQLLAHQNYLALDVALTSQAGSGRLLRAPVALN